MSSWRAGALLTILIALCAAGATTACGRTPPPASAGEEAPRALANTETAAAPAPESLVLTQYAWLLERLAASDGGPFIDAESYAERFTAEFVEAVPLESVNALLSPLAAAGAPQQACTVRETPQHLQTYLTSGDGETAMLVSLYVEAEPPHRISGFRLAPASWLTEAPSSGDWAPVLEGLQAVAPQVSVYAAEVIDGALHEVAGLEVDAQLAVGSAFKLWVLAALADEIRAGRRAWDEPVVIDDAQRSLSSAHLDKVPHGESRTLQELATSMIQVSDNTATDILVLLLGRPVVEAAMRASGHAEPERNQPFLTTRDMFWLKLQAPEETLQAYLEGDEASRRALIEPGVSFDLGTAYWKAASWTEPRLIDRIEWFASARDLARALVGLRELATEPGLEPVLEVMTQNPGLALCGGFSGVMFKGGSEPGVLNLSWLLRRNDERVFALVVTVNAPESLIDQARVFELAFTAAQLVGAVP